MAKPLLSAAGVGRCGRRQDARRLLRRIGISGSVLLAALTLVGSGGAIAVSTVTPAAAPPAAEDQIFTWGLDPGQIKDKPYRPTFAYDVTPGQVIQDMVRVKNFTGGTIDLNVYATDAINSDTGSLDLLAAADKPKKVGTWISLEKRTVRIDANGKVDIPFTVKIPASGVEPGDHVGGIVTSLVVDPANTAGSPVKLDKRVGTAVQVRMAGPLNPQLAITDLSTSYGNTRNPVGRGTMSTTYTVTNMGNVRMGADQVIEIKSPIGFPSSTFRPDAIAELLPGNSVRLTYDVDGVWPTIRSSTKVTLTSKPARPDETFNNTTAGASASTGDWTLPWATLVALLLLAGAGKIQRDRKRRLGNINAAELEAIVDARLGQPATGEPTPNGYVGANGHANGNGNGHVTNGHSPHDQTPPPLPTDTPAGPGAGRAAL